MAESARDTASRDYSLTGSPFQTFQPMLYTPVTRLTEHWFSYAETPCAKHERVLIRCANQLSRDQMYKKCTKEIEDFEECVFNKKQIARYISIQNERLKQNKFAAAPPPGSYVDDI